MLNDMDLSQNEETSYSQNEYQQKIMMIHYIKQDHIKNAAG